MFTAAISFEGVAINLPDATEVMARGKVVVVVFLPQTESKTRETQ